MPVKASNQKTLMDLTDGYSVILTNDNYTFLGDTDSVSSTQSTTCQIQALQGANQVACEVGEITTPTGLSIVSDGKTPIPTLTITATAAEGYAMPLQKFSQHPHSQKHCHEPE